MLDTRFFNSEIEKLKQQFGDRAFSQRKSDLIYLAIKHLDQRDVSEITDYFIGNARYAPSLDDFKGRARGFNKTALIKSECVFCSGGGALSFYLKTNGACHAFSCTCSAGRNHPGWQRWEERFKKDFTRMPPKRMAAFGQEGVKPYEDVKGDFSLYLEKTKNMTTDELFKEVSKALPF